MILYTVGKTDEVRRGKARQAEKGQAGRTQRAGVLDAFCIVCVRTSRRKRTAQFNGGLIS